MRKFTFILSLLVAFVTTAMAQGTRLTASELNEVVGSKRIAIRCTQVSNYTTFYNGEGRVAELTPSTIFVWENAGDGNFYIKKAYGADESTAYLQSNNLTTFGAVESAAKFTAVKPYTGGAGVENFGGADCFEDQETGGEYWVRLSIGSTWFNFNGMQYNGGTGVWTVQNVLDMSNYYQLTINSVVGEEITTTTTMVEAGAAITVEDKAGYTHDFVAQNMPAADTEITVTYTVDENAETPEPTYLVNISTEENRKYYKIASYNRGGFLSTVGDDAAVQHVAETTASYWYFIESSKKDGSVYFRNYTTEQYLGSDMKMSATAADWYILENGVNNEGYSICKTNAIGGGCIDANNYNTGVGTWNPSASDWHGTTWVFVEVEDPAAGEAALEAAKAELTATAANATAILTAANLSVSTTPVTLTVGNLSSNAVEPNEGSLEGLVDGDPSTFFHTNWSANGASDDDQDHYLLVDLGEGKSITNLQFNYHTRQGAANDFPVDIIVAGSNNGTEFTEITTVKDIPVVTADKDYTSPTILNATAYRYIRLMVTKTSYDRVSTGAAHNYWHMAEFGLSDAVITVADEYKDAVKEVVALDAAMKSVTSLDGMTLDEVNAAKAALTALIEDVENIVETPETPETTIIGKLIATASDAWDWTSEVTWTTPAAGTYDALLTATEGADIDGATFDAAYVVSTEQLLQVTDMGDVTVAFKWTGGNHRIDVLGVDLLKDGAVVYSKYNVGFSGGAGVPVEYKMEDVEAGTYTLRYLSTNQKNNNSKGTITITYSEAVVEPELPDETIISNLADANPNKAYTATANRASWAVDAEGTAMATTSELDAENLNHQFAFIKGSDENYYLWSVGAQKFVTPSATLSTTLCKPIKFNDGSSVGAGRVVVQFVDNVNGYFNINGEKNLVVDSWSSADDGNAVKFVEVADFDPTTAEAALEAYLSTGVYKEELNAIIAELDVIVAGVGTQIGCYTSSDAEYAAKLAAIKEFAASMDDKTAEQIQAQIAAAEALKATFTVVNPVAGNYYFIKNNPTVWTANDLAVYGDAGAPGWKAFAENNLTFWWKAVEVEGGIAFQNVQTKTYLTGNANRSGAWTLSETANPIAFAACGYSGDNALVNITLAGWNMHANQHGNGSNVTGSNIVSWNGGADGASAWVIVDGDAQKLADTYRSTVEAEIVGLEALTGNLGSNYGQYGCDEELKAQIEAFDVENATYDELVAIMDVINEFKGTFKINVPKKGCYLRIKAYSGWNDDARYLASVNSTAQSGRAAFVTDGTEANTIFYYTADSALVSVGSGEYLVSNANMLGYNGIQDAGSKIKFQSATNGALAGYNITFNNGTRYLYVNTNDYTDAGSGTNDTNGYVFNLEVVSSIPVTVTSAGYATFYAPVAVTIPEGVEAYYAAGVAGESVTLEQIENTIPANTGVILKADAGTYNFALETVSVAASIEDNLLSGTVRKQVVTKEATGSYYVLGVVDGVVGMYNPVNGEDGDSFINAGHKAYMYVEGAASSAGYRFDFGGTTGINEVETEESDLVIYDLTGRRVNEMNRPGIYIVNGKKVLVK